MKGSWKKLMAVTGLVLVVATGVGWRWNQVREVIDGDTIVLGSGQKVRLLGIDAPDLENCGGTEAKEKLENIVLGKRIKLTEIKVDPYDRILALVYVGKTLINQRMVLSGWARWDGTENTLGNTLSKAAEIAKNEKMGVYGNCREPDDPDCIVKGNIEKRSGEADGGRRLYSFPGCTEYEAVIVEKELGEQWFCTEKEAVKAGYIKSGNCFGKEWNGK